jgi:hypothetical protein
MRRREFIAVPGSTPAFATLRKGDDGKLVDGVFEEQEIA